MLKDRTLLEQKLEKLCESIVFDPTLKDNITNEINRNYEMPVGRVTDFISGRDRFETLNKIALYHFSQAIDNNAKFSSKLVNEFFSDIEKHEFQFFKYEDPTRFEFPIRIKAFKMEDDCWIGNSSAKFFLSLQKASLIRYNANTQRVMRKIIKGNEEAYKIFVNKKAVNQITKSMKDRTFIPNVITLNFPEDAESSFKYDEDNMEFVIYNMDYIDITDGYHRLLAMCKCNADDENFDYPMCVRITNYSEQKARQFIAQEDKKTQMKPSDSKSMDSNLESNFVVERLNNDLDSNLRGVISRNGGSINYSMLSEFIDYVFFKGKKEPKKIEILKSLKTSFNFATDLQPEMIEGRPSVSRICGIVVIAAEYTQPDVLQEKLIKFMESTYDTDFKRPATKKIYTEILEYVEGV